MSPQAIFLYEIDESFGPNILAQYFLIKQELPKSVLTDFIKKHVEKEFKSALSQKDGVRYFSNKIDTESLEKKNLYLGFILKEEEDMVSIKSIFETIEEKILKAYTPDKDKMEVILKDSLNSILSLMEKLKEPAIIVDTINNKTKKMIDEGNLQEARELIDLGEEIPEKLAAEIKLAEDYLNEKAYKKAKKSYLKAAELAESIQEYEIVSFLRYKAEEIGTLPDLIKESEQLYKDVNGLIDLLQENQLHLYHELNRPLNRLINISSSFEEEEKVSKLAHILSYSNQADRIAKELFNLDKKIKDSMENL
ncbi:MAG: hypothetical protein EU548_08355 [Promethearchaeota archaeon]|nr:MAG: hypothetical protein EU548_08355 [Candidatus Lokiarchaeota archaeon]